MGVLRAPTFILIAMPRVKLFDEKEVLTKAMNLFWKQGYSATSVQDLVSHLGINRASIYDTYGDKEQLFFKAFENYRQINTEWMTNFFQGEPDVKKGLRLLFEMAIDESLKDKDRKGCFVVNATTELVPGDEKVVQLLKQNRTIMEGLFYDYLKKGESEGQFAKGLDLKAMAALLFTIYNGIKVVTKVQRNKQELVDSVNLALSLLV